MLIIANGAFKSGSTWLRNLVRQMAEYAPIPKAYQRPGLETWIDPGRFAAFLKNVDCRSANYITKSHLYHKRYVSLLLGHEDVRVLCIARDLRDVLVSHYFHMIREGQIRESRPFASYYWSIGRYKAQQVMEYHHAWGVESPRLYTSAFERLKGDFVGEVARIAAFLGFDVPEKRILEIQEETSLARQRKRLGEEDKPESQRFFRKGIVGDYKNHFDEAMLADVAEVQQRGLRGLALLKYHVAFTARLAVRGFVQQQTGAIRRALRHA